MQTYQTITSTGPVTVKSTASLPADCYWKNGFSRTVSATVSPPQSEERQMTPDIDDEKRLAPTDGLWSEVRRSGEVKMTSMYAGKVRVKNRVGSVPHHILAGSQDLIASGAIELPDGTCNTHRVPPHSIGHPVAIAQLEYSENGDISYWAEKLKLAIPEIHPALSEPPAVKQLKAEALQELFQAYNLGEELWEIRESFKTIHELLRNAVKPLETIKDQLKAGANGAAAAWMTYRYGVMPIVYSIQDVAKLLGTKSNVVTVRKRKSEDPILLGPERMTSCFWEDGATSGVWNITAKGVWSTSLQQQLDRVNFNPATTAMSVYRFAWVVRWFINLNSWLDVTIKQFTTLARYNACVSKKTYIDKTTYLRYYHNGRDLVLPDIPADPIAWAGWTGVKGQTVKNKHPLGTFTDVALRDVNVEMYTRYTYQPSDVELVWNPYLDWKRALDAISLLLPVTQRAFRRLHV